MNARGGDAWGAPRLVLQQNALTSSVSAALSGDELVEGRRERIPRVAGLARGGRASGWAGRAERGGFSD